MSFQTHHMQAKKDFVSNKGEISLLLQEIDSLESKKQELLKTLSFYSSSISKSEPKTLNNASVSSNVNPIKSNAKQFKTLNKDLTKEELNYTAKSDAANKPSHLYMALAKYLFYETNGEATSDLIKEETDVQKDNNHCLFEYEAKKFAKGTIKKSFDNESLESVSTKDNYSITAFEQSSFNINNTLIDDKEKFVWNVKNQKLLCKYADELNNDWTQIAQRFNNKKLTPKMVKDHLNHKDTTPKTADPSTTANNNSSKRTRSRFTLSEDQKIISLIQKIGQNWRDIAKALPGRTEGMVKNRFYSHIKRKYFNLVQNVKNTNNSNGKEEEELKENPLEIEKVCEFNVAFNEMINEEEKNQTNSNTQENHEFLAFFEEGPDCNGTKIEFEENFELNLLKTPETAYNFDDYNQMLKLTPHEIDRDDSLMHFQKIEEFDENDDLLNNSSYGDSHLNEKLKIRFLSTKIEDIESLLQQTKSQINKLYSVE